MKRHFIITIILSLLACLPSSAAVDEYDEIVSDNGAGCFSPYFGIWHSGSSSIKMQTAISIAIDNPVRPGYYQYHPVFILSFLYYPSNQFNLSPTLTDSNTHKGITAKITLASGEVWTATVDKIYSTNMGKIASATNFSLIVIDLKSNSADLSSYNLYDKWGYIFYRLRTSSIRSVSVAGTSINIPSDVNTASRFDTITRRLSRRINLPQVLDYNPYAYAMPSGKTTINGHSYFWNARKREAEERLNPNGILTINYDQNLHCISIGVNYIWSAILNRHNRNESRWTTRKGIIDVQMPPNVVIGDNDEIISWEYHNSTYPDHNHSIIFFYNPSTRTLQCAYNNRTSGNIAYYWSTDVPMWPAFKAMLLRELPLWSTCID